MKKHLWAHTREMRVDVFQHKVVYDIPLGRETIFKNFKIEIKEDSIKLTTFQSPTPPRLVKPLCDNPLIETERPAENDRYSSFRPPVCYEMK